jgi:hypothetical protein
MNDIGHFPMSENHDLFRRYLLQALQIIESKTGTGSTAADGARRGAQDGGEGRAGAASATTASGAQGGEQDKGLVDKIKDKLT